MESLAGKHILVLGLGLHGGAIANISWLAVQGADVLVSDTKSRELLASSVEQLANIPNVSFHFGNQDELDIYGTDMILRNPAVPYNAPILAKARIIGIPIEMDSGLFFSSINTTHVIGVTGSKGKTTTSHAIASVLGALHPPVVAVGVDGVSPLGQLQNIDSATTVIFELSSWRLEALKEKHISPRVAVVTSIYKDHLNTYASYDEYIATKKQIIADQKEDDIAILNYDDAILKTWNTAVHGTLYWFSLTPIPERSYGIWIEGDTVMARITNDTTQLCPVADIPHTSLHELRNKLPAILLALLQKDSTEDIIRAVQQVPALKHRLQTVRTTNDVQYINDSAATMPDATIAALASFQEKHIVLILGGSDKALEFENLAEAISHADITHLIWLPGTATKHMQEVVLPLTQAQSHDVTNMQEAVTLAHTLAQPSDVVLMSPGATSFGLFLHEFDRGNAFITAVERL